MNSIESLKPADTPDYMMPAWLGCISFAMNTPDVFETFRTETGNKWQPARTPIDRMIDESIGAEWEFIKAFVLWVNVNVWGPVERQTEPSE